MTLSNTKAKYLSFSAVIVIIGIILSGPLGVFVVDISAPQPLWQSAKVFVENYSSIQSMPFAFGFLLLFGFLFFFSSLLNAGRESQRPLEVMGLVLTAICCSLAGLNYTIQVAYIPNALDQSEIILSLFAMANPGALSWAIEMFAYSFLGLATIIVAPLFSGGGLQRIIKWLLIFNGIASVGGAVVAALDLTGVLSSNALIGYYLWNALIVIIMLLVIIEFRFGKTPQSKFVSDI